LKARFSRSQPGRWELSPRSCCPSPGPAPPIRPGRSHRNRLATVRLHRDFRARRGHRHRPAAGVEGQQHRAPASLNNSGNSGTGRRHPLRSLMVVGQVAVSCVVLIGAAMALRSFVFLAHSPTGFKVENRTVASFDLGLQNYSPEQGLRFQALLLERLRALPGVESASLATSPPLDVYMNMKGQSPPPARPRRPPARPPRWPAFTSNVNASRLSACASRPDATLPPTMDRERPLSSSSTAPLPDSFSPARIRSAVAFRSRAKWRR